MRKSTRAVLFVAGTTLLGCPKSEGSGSERAPSANPDAAAEAGAAPTSLAPKTEKDLVVTYIGHYEVTVGTLYVPAEKDWASVKFKNDVDKFLGEGAMTLTVDPSGRVTGNSDSGPLGAARLDGRRENGVLTATLRRSDPTDDGLTGTLIAKVTNDALTGTMNLAESSAAVVRLATFEAKKK